MNEARAASLLRSAAWDEAAEVTPCTAPTFAQAALPVPRPRPRYRPLTGPLAPLLAAVAVVAVVALAFTLSSVLPGSGPASRPGTRANAGLVLAANAIPPYDVGLTATGTPVAEHPFTLTVRSTLTGKALATVTPPASLGTFSLVDGTANPDTFLVGAEPWHPASGSGNPGDTPARPVTLFLLRYDPATRAVRLAPVPLTGLELAPVVLPTLARTGPTGAGLTSVAISPDGTRLAVVYASYSKGVRIRTWITVYVLGGPTLGPWSAPGRVTVTFDGRSVMQDANLIGTLSWAADDATLAFPLIGKHGGVYLLNTKDTGNGPLFSMSRLVLPLTDQESSSDFVCYDTPRLLADGADVLCGGYAIPAGWSIAAKGLPNGPVAQGFGEFSVATGKLVAILGQVRAPLSDAASPASYLLWASADARVTIGLTNSGHAVLVRDGHTTRLPWPHIASDTWDAAPLGIAW
jgi:hypothetical protein